MERTLNLGPAVRDKWAALSEFLQIDYPPFSYPSDEDLGQRDVPDAKVRFEQSATLDLKSDTSPWIIRKRKKWRGVPIASMPQAPAVEATLRWTSGSPLQEDQWLLRSDTFPSNLALFSSANFNHGSDGPGTITFLKEQTSVRQFTSAAIASRNTHLYGRFGAAVRPSNVPGLITGIFLHRNGPRQEIDIEFLGRDTTKMLVNVYYNPGPEGTKLEYGYRGTPTQISLGFDAAEDFHTYEIEWCRESIRWRVDGSVVYERLQWNPTPIPDLPLEFNVNLWHSRSQEFAGRLESTKIPATTKIQSIQLRTQRWRSVEPTSETAPGSWLSAETGSHDPDPA